MIEAMQVDGFTEAQCLLVTYCDMSAFEAQQYIEKTAMNAHVQEAVIVAQIIHVYK